MEILLIDDDAKILQKVQKTFKDTDAGIICLIADSCEKALEMLKIHNVDLVLLDMKFSNSISNSIQGLKLIEILRNSKLNMPIIVISGTHEIQEKIKALDLGADDYILKPFDQNELLARVKRHIFRNNNHCNSKFKVGPLSLDMDTKIVTVTDGAGEDHILDLTNKEYQLLEILVLKKGVILSKETLISKVYAGRDEPEIKIMDVLICKIRRKIAAFTKAKPIVTVWGRGYMINDKVPVNTTSKVPHITKPTMKNIASSPQFIF